MNVLLSPGAHMEADHRREDVEHLQRDEERQGRRGELSLKAERNHGPVPSISDPPRAIYVLFR